MKKVFVDEPNHVLIDVCHDRHGLWFDVGEVEHLLKSLAGKYTGKAGPPQDVMEFIGKVFKARA